MSHERDARARIESLRARDRKALQGLVFDAIASGQADASALPRLCMRASARVALAASGKLAPALRALHLAASIADPDGDAVDALAAVAAGGEARDLLHFALSDAHLDLRART